MTPPSPSESPSNYRFHSYPISPCSNIKRDRVEFRGEAQSSPLPTSKRTIPQVSFYVASNTSPIRNGTTTPQSPSQRAIENTEALGIPELKLLYGAGPVVEYPTSPTSEISFRRSIRRSIKEEATPVDDSPEGDAREEEDDEEETDNDDTKEEVIDEIEAELALFKQHITDVKSSIVQLESVQESLERKLNLLRRKRALSVTTSELESPTQRIVRRVQNRNISP